MGSVSRTSPFTTQHLTSSSARATSATPMIFKPLYHHASRQTYADGAIYHNNPIQIADKERKLIWPTMEDEWPDFVLSIGTGFSQSSSPAAEKTTSSRKAVFSHKKSLYKTAKNRIDTGLDSETTWNTYMDVLQPPRDYKSRYLRLNPQLAEDPPGLDEVEQMEYIQNLTRDKFSDDDRIRKAARRMIASSFYFEKSVPEEPKEDHAFQCQGLSRCHASMVHVLISNLQVIFIAACYRIATRSSN